MAFFALATGVSGLQAFTQGVGVIADNITNVNTVGYKGVRSRFSTLVTETTSTAQYSPGGVQHIAQTLISSQGLLQPTGTQSDLSIDGAGFFVVRDDPSATNQDGELLYTRAGAFRPDNDGFFRNTAGFTLLGWPIDRQGNLPANLTTTDELQPINVSDLNGLGDDTNNVSVRINLDAQTPLFPGTYNVGDLASGAASADFTTNLQIFDSLGRSHTVLLSAIKTGVNTWDYELAFDDPAQLDPAHVDGLIGSGQLVFNTDGSIDTTASTLNDIGGTAVGVNNPLIFDYDPAGGPDAVAVEQGNITFNFGTNGQSNGFTQSRNESTQISSSIDGARFGSVTGARFGEDGVVTAVFSNGLTLPVYQLPIVTFPNVDGLDLRQGNAFGQSPASGNAALQIAGSSGAGTVAPQSLELSTVDLAEEFSELIRVQRAFSASSRIITTSDEILTELTQLI